MLVKYNIALVLVTFCLVGGFLVVVRHSLLHNVNRIGAGQSHRANFNVSERCEMWCVKIRRITTGTVYLLILKLNKVGIGLVLHISVISPGTIDVCFCYHGHFAVYSI